MRLDEAALDGYTDLFSRSALRFETMDHYDVASDDDGFLRYVQGRPPADDFGVGWRAWLRARAAEGRDVFRIRVVHTPPSPYLRFECEWGYTGNADSGEQIRVLDLTERERPAGLVDAEFWLLDDARAAVMTYDELGAFRYADTVEGAAANRYVDAARQAWDAGEPFEQWWDRHPEYHRASWLDGAAPRG